MNKREFNNLIRKIVALGEDKGIVPSTPKEALAFRKAICDVKVRALSSMAEISLEQAQHVSLLLDCLNQVYEDKVALNWLAYGEARRNKKSRGKP